MTNNDVLRGVRFTLNLADTHLVALFALTGHELDVAAVRARMAREEDDDRVACTDEELAGFLDGLILERRGPAKPGAPRAASTELTNNAIFRKLRIALSLQEADVLGMLRAGGHPFSKSELSALFRKPSHKHYRVCGDQVLRAFLRGLTMTLRPEVIPSAE